MYVIHTLTFIKKCRGHEFEKGWEEGRIFGEGRGRNNVSNIKKNCRLIIVILG